MPVKGKQKVELGVLVPTNPVIVNGTLDKTLVFGKMVTVKVLFAPHIGVVCPIQVWNWDAAMILMNDVDRSTSKYLIFQKIHCKVVKSYDNLHIWNTIDIEVRIFSIVWHRQPLV